MKRSRRALEALVSGFVVYGLMAACSSSGMLTGGTTSSGGHTGGGGHAGTGGMPGTGGVMGAGGDSGIMDVLTDPVPSAEAGVENPQSGTRLKGKFTMGSDGSKEYQYATTEIALNNSQGLGLGVHAVWYDSMLMADCSFYTASDGTQRCMPGHLANIYFEDNQCTKPAIVVINAPFGCTPAAVPSYVLYQTFPGTNGCPVTLPPVHVAQVGAAFTPTALYGIYPNGMGGVQCGDETPSSSFSAYHATEVPPSTFVQGSAGIDP